MPDLRAGWPNDRVSKASTHKHLVVCGLSLALLSCLVNPLDEQLPLEPSLRRVADPGLPRHDEHLPVSTLFLGLGASARAVDRVVSVAPIGRAWVRPDATLVVDEVVVETDVLPGLSMRDDGSVAYARRGHDEAKRDETDIYLRSGDGRTRRVTTDGRSDRPVFLDDGTLLWISSAGTGRAGWIHDGVRLGGYPELPVPARPDRTRLEEGLVVFDAGDAEYALAPGRRTVKRRGPRP